MVSGLSVDDLKKIGLFGALPNPVLQQLVDSLPVVEMEPGAFVFREGDPARDLFVVLAGEMEVTKHSRRGGETRVALLGPGDWFGEMSILDVQPRSASVRILAPARLMRLSSGELDKMYRSDVKAYALIVLNIARELSRRLRVTDGILADFVVNVMDSYVGLRGPTKTGAGDATVEAKKSATPKPS